MHSYIYDGRTHIYARGTGGNNQTFECGVKSNFLTEIWRTYRLSYTYLSSIYATVRMYGRLGDSINYRVPSRHQTPPPLTHAQAARSTTP